MDPLAILLVSPYPKQHAPFEKLILKRFPGTLVFPAANVDGACAAVATREWDLIFCIPISPSHPQSTCEMLQYLRARIRSQTPLYVGTHNLSLRTQFIFSGCTDVIQRSKLNVFVLERIRTLIDARTVVPDATL